MTWWKASSVTVTAGQSTVTVNTGDDIGMIKGAEGLVIGNQPPVEIKRSYLNASVMMLELMAPWPYANQSGQPAIAFPTDGDLAAATAVLKQLINGFTIATEVQMQEATNNVNATSALRVKQAIDFHRALMSSMTDTTTGRVMTVGTAFGLGSTAAPFSIVPDNAIFNGFYSTSAQWDNSPYPGLDPANQGTLITLKHGDPSYGTQIWVSLSVANDFKFRRIENNAVKSWVTLYSSSNTAVDSNGFVKAASPIIKLFHDKILLNGNFAAEFEKLNVGHYLIKKTEGFADIGWYIETPKDANGNIKVFVRYEQLADKTIVIKTYEPDYSNGKAAAGIPCDIPPDRWIDIRLKEPGLIN